MTRREALWLRVAAEVNKSDPPPIEEIEVFATPITPHFRFYSKPDHPTVFVKIRGPMKSESA